MIVGISREQADRCPEIAAGAQSADLSAQSETSCQQEFSTATELQRGVRLTRHAHPARSGKEVAVRVLSRCGRQTKNENCQTQPEQSHCHLL